MTNSFNTPNNAFQHKEQCKYSQFQAQVKRVTAGFYTTIPELFQAIVKPSNINSHE